MAKKKKPRGRPDYRMAWFLFTSGVIAFGLGAWGAVTGLRTLKWPGTDAEIVDAKLKLHERETRDVQRPDKRHTFAVRYLYHVGGKTYLGGGIEPYDFNMQNSAGAHKMADAYPEMADAYPVGSKARVAYDPGNPAEAYLMPGPSSLSLLLLGIGAAFWLVALLARRMIRIGPGENDEGEVDAGKKNAAKKPLILGPKIADYYPKPETAKPPT